MSKTKTKSNILTVLYLISTLLVTPAVLALFIWICILSTGHPTTVNKFWNEGIYVVFAIGISLQILIYFVVNYIMDVIRFVKNLFKKKEGI